MKTQSTEAQRNHEQAQANKSRLARWRRENRRIEAHTLTPEQIPLNLTPSGWWFKVQAD